MVGGEEEERKKGFPSFLLGLLFEGSKVAECCCSCSYFLRLRVLTLLCRKPSYGAEIYFSKTFLACFPSLSSFSSRNFWQRQWNSRSSWCEEEREKEKTRRSKKRGKSLKTGLLFLGGRRRPFFAPLSLFRAGEVAPEF